MKKALLLLAVPITFAVQAAPADDMKTLLEKGLDKEAFQLGRDAPRLLGEPAFDYFFGIAAINAGSPGEGTLALERYLLHFPDNRSAQFHLARGFFALGDDINARQGFQLLAKEAQGDELQAVTRFLDAIQARESRYKPTLNVWAETAIGHDSNINGGVLAGPIQGLPAGFLVQPGQTSEKRADAFGSVGAGVQGSVPLLPGLALYGGASGTMRAQWNRDNDLFDQGNWGLFGGVTDVSGRHYWRAGLDFNQLALARQRYLNLMGMSVEGQYQADPFNRWGAQAQWSRQSYQNITTYLDVSKTTAVLSNADVRDSDLSLVGASWRRTFLGSWSPVLVLTVNAGRETSRKDRPDLSRDIQGAKLGLTAQPAGRWTVGAAVAWQQSRYRGEFAPGLASRKDDTSVLELYVSYALDRRWSARLDVSRHDQRSNIGLYQFNRDVVALKVRYESP